MADHWRRGALEITRLRHYHSRLDHHPDGVRLTQILKIT
jgi:hypothetical protein